MPVWEDIELEIDVDQVLQGQGADPHIIRERRPKLLTAAEDALQTGSQMINPRVLYKEFNILELRHNKIMLNDGNWLKGKLPANHLGTANKVILSLCTIGSDLGKRTSQLMQTDPVRAIALEGFGGAAVEELANIFCRNLEVKAEKEGQQTTIPLFPGMIGWSVEEGQTQIFHLLNAEKIGVSLSASLMMIPRKSLSMAIGIGKEINNTDSTCDYCTMKDTCRYKDLDD